MATIILGTPSFENPLKNTIQFNLAVKQIKPYGNIVYEYNPLRNFRVSEERNDYNGDKIEPGMLTDLDTKEFNFSLNNPVDIQCQDSYDGSVNLILNDGINQPKLINTRFTVRQNNTYEVVDRVGSNDTNIYDEDQFELDTSLYKRINLIPKIQFNGLNYGGNLPVGNYNFYFKYSDADGNETDFIGESGTVVCHIGNINDPSSIRGGMENENSNKIVQFVLTNLDTAYDYLTIYYTRLTSGIKQEPITEAKKINRKFKIRDNSCLITIDGYERTTDVSLEELNQRYFITNSAKTQAICNNRLFLGNLSNNSLDIVDLQDISLRMLPYYIAEDASTTIGELDHTYQEDKGNKGEYYNVENIYNKLGYWNEEIYRLGVVYILNDDTLSPVFNIRGRNQIPTLSNINDSTSGYKSCNAAIGGIDGERNYIVYDEISYLIEGSNYNDLDNAKGVIRINHSSGEVTNPVYSLGVYIPEEVKTYLSKKVKGLFFVRQKRIPTILAQAFTIATDRLSGLPTIPQYRSYSGDMNGNKYKTNGDVKPRNEYKYLLESFIDKKAKLDAGYTDRLIYLDELYVSKEAAICPEFNVRQEYFNNFFTDTEFVIKEPNDTFINTVIDDKKGLLQDSAEERHYYLTKYTTNTNNDNWSFVKIIGIPDSITAKRNQKNLYSAIAGSAESVSDFKFVGKEFTIDYSKSKGVLNTVTGIPQSSSYDNNIVRGAFGPYIGITGYTGEPCKLINIYIPNYSTGNMKNYFKIRYDDSSSYQAINERMSINDINNIVNIGDESNKRIGYTISNVYRGDCYICNYTYRVNRNFQDLSAPNADSIVDEYCWRNNYEPNKKPEELTKINIGDLNAVRLGSWITIKIRSNVNLSMRDVDFSYPDEALLTGQQRTFYPLTELSTDGNYKIPESTIINNGISNTLSQRYNFTQLELPYYKDTFQTRIAFSDLTVSDAFKNGFRTFQASHYRDYPSTYGGLMKLVTIGDDLLAVFEHGTAIVPVNERITAGEGSGGNVYINQQQVLPETLKMISTDFGTQWPESVLKTPYGIYGVDTVGKKIWRTNGTAQSSGSFQTISDFCVQEFLNQNITLSERELTPIIGIRNVKTHYNAFKNDVMFTFYDNLYGFEDKAWNLCYNEILAQKGNGFQTFYSWIPSYSANIDNIFFSFDRDTSKVFSKLGTCRKSSTTANGIVLRRNNDNVADPNVGRDDSDDCLIRLNVIKDDVGTLMSWYPKGDCDFYLELVGKEIPDDDRVTITYTLERDVWGNYKYFNIGEYNQKKNVLYLKCQGGVLQYENRDLSTEERNNLQWFLYDHFNEPIYLNIKATVTVNTDGLTSGNLYDYLTSYKSQVEYDAGYYESQIVLCTDVYYNSLTTAFWKHGQSGIMDSKEKIKPCYWYGKQHPFEFEFIVNQSIEYHKIFDSLQIISNNAPPESFHYEVIGDSYEFSEDKMNMFIRQEYTKMFYQYNGVDITYDRNVLEMSPEQRNFNLYSLGYQEKSTVLPGYFYKRDSYNTVEDFYENYTVPTGYNWSHLAGGDLVYYPTLHEFRICNHARAVDIKTEGRLRGNMSYIQDKWYIQINPLNFVQKNEKWQNKDKNGNDVKEKIPLALQTFIPRDGIITIDTKGAFPEELVKKGYYTSDLDVSVWGKRKEVPMRDKFMKVKVRYKGDKLAVIGGIKTLFRIV